MLSSVPLRRSSGPGAPMPAPRILSSSTPAASTASSTSAARRASTCSGGSSGSTAVSARARISPGEVDDADGEARAHELDPDRVAGVGVDPQRALAAAAVGIRVLDHGAGGEQAAGDVADRLQRQPGRGGDRRPADRPARPHQPQHDDLVVVLHASEVRPPLPRPTLPECHVLDDTQLVNSFALVGHVPPRCVLVGGVCSWVNKLHLSSARGRLRCAAERHGPGGPSGLQNRQAVVARRLEGSIPSPLRLVL